MHIGEPVDASLDVGLAAHKGATIRAREIVGSALDPAAEVSNRVLTVKTLLTPLSREQVKLVRCLGLNYKDHAVSAILQCASSSHLAMGRPRRRWLCRRKCSYYSIVQC